MSRKKAVLMSGFVALGLAACATSPAIMSQASMPDPSGSVAGTYLSARFAASEGDVKGAAGFYADTLKDNPDNADILARTFAFSAEAGNIGQAIVLSDRILARDPTNLPAQFVRRMGRLAAKDYAGVLAMEGDDQAGGFTALTDAIVRAWALAGQKDSEGAILALDALAGQRGVDGIRLIHRAMILEYLGRDADAEEAYKNTIDVTGTGPRASDAYGRFLQRKGRVEDAKALYTRVLAENPNHPVAAQALRELGSRRVTQPLVSSPAEGVAEALFGISASLNDRRGAGTAILYLNIALYLRPDFDLARVLLAGRYEMTSRYEMANAIYSGIESSSPYYGMTQVQSALNDGRMQRLDSGIQKLKALSVSQPGQPDVWTALGDLLRSAERYGEARAAYDKAVAVLQPGDRRLAGLYYARGVSFAESERWEDAERDFRAALRINPDRADVLNYLGYSLVERGIQYEEAVAMLEKARALRPLDGFIADSVGWAYYKLGRYQEAVRALEEAVQLTPGAPEVNDHLGDAYWRIGRLNDARFQWQHALAMNPQETQRETLERKIQYGLETVALSGG